MSYAPGMHHENVVDLQNKMEWKQKPPAEGMDASLRDQAAPFAQLYIY
jgi:hypothetical protein